MQQEVAIDFKGLDLVVYNGIIGYYDFIYPLINYLKPVDIRLATTEEQNVFYKRN